MEETTEISQRKSSNHKESEVGGERVSEVTHLGICTREKKLKQS